MIKNGKKSEKYMTIQEKLSNIMMKKLVVNLYLIKNI